jgi:hypothetical protein
VVKKLMLAVLNLMLTVLGSPPAVLKHKLLVKKLMPAVLNHMPVVLKKCLLFLT